MMLHVQQKRLIKTLNMMSGVISTRNWKLKDKIGALSNAIKNQKNIKKKNIN